MQKYSELMESGMDGADHAWHTRRMLDAARAELMTVGGGEDVNEYAYPDFAQGDWLFAEDDDIRAHCGLRGGEEAQVEAEGSSSGEEEVVASSSSPSSLSSGCMCEAAIPCDADNCENVDTDGNDTIDVMSRIIFV